MGAYSRIAAVSVMMMLVAISTVIGAAEATELLTPDFYHRSCPQLFPIVKTEVRRAVAKEPRMAASLIRLHFHDCFVQGCDGSLLLDNTTDIFTEKDALANNRGSARGFEVIDAIKVALEKSCPNTVSCADILAVTSRDSAVEVGLARPYPVLFGRRDSLNASVAEANRNLPSPLSVYDELKQNFSVQGLDERDLIALSGAHTIGRVRCQLVNLFLNDTDSNAAFKDGLRKSCPQDNETEALEVLENLDVRTPDRFDNSYYRNLQRGEGIIRSDQTLWSTPGTNMRLVDAFARNQELFFHQFAMSTIKMGNIRPLTGDQGEIRKNCRKRNSDLESPLVAVE